MKCIAQSVSNDAHQERKHLMKHTKDIDSKFRFPGDPDDGWHSIVADPTGKLARCAALETI